MISFDYTFFIQIANFIILIVILNLSALQAAF